MNPAGRARLRPSEYRPSHEEPDDEYPLRLTTGRTLYQFHTRTKTDCAPQLHDAAPDAWVEISAPDAERLGIAEGDMVRVESRRGHMEARARVSGIKPGVVFVPFHYGYFDEPGRDRPNGRARAANELTMTRWDPISKQPAFKIAAVRVSQGRRRGRHALALRRRTPPPRPMPNGRGGAVPRPTVGGAAAEATSTIAGGLIDAPRKLSRAPASGERDLADALRQVGEQHKDEPDIEDLCHTFAAAVRAACGAVRPFMERLQGARPGRAGPAAQRPLQGTREGGLALLRDLHDLYLMATEVEISWDVIGQAAQGARTRNSSPLSEDARKRRSAR